MTLTTRRKTAAGALLAATLLTGALALNAPSASAADDTAPSTTTTTQDGVRYGGGAVDLNGNPVDTRTVVSDTPPADLGEPICSATVNADGTVTDTKGDCDGLQENVAK